MHEVYSVEYRLLQHAPFPAVVQDAAAVYAHVVEQYGIAHDKCKLVLIGDSSGGNLVLALARWLRDEGHLPLPHGLLLLSPSCDASHALPETLSSYIPRPNAASDYLVDTPEPRALLQRTFLGFATAPATPAEERRLMVVAHSEYISPCSPVVLHRWGHAAEQDPAGAHEEHFVRHVFQRLPTALRAARAPSNLAPPLHTAPPATAALAAVVAATASEVSLPAGAAVLSDPPLADEPAVDGPRTLFGGFPRTLLLTGDAERLVREVRSLARAMGEDGVDLTVHWARDACHDPLILSAWWWDRSVLEECWCAVARWAEGFGREEE